MAEDCIHIVVVPADGLCEGCREPFFNDEIFETDDMVTVCQKCWEEYLEVKPIKKKGE